MSQLPCSERLKKGFFFGTQYCIEVKREYNNGTKDFESYIIQERTHEDPYNPKTVTRKSLFGTSYHVRYTDSIREQDITLGFVPYPEYYGYYESVHGRYGTSVTYSGFYSLTQKPCQRTRIYRKPAIIAGCKVRIIHESVARIPNPIPGFDDIWKVLSRQEQNIYFPGQQIGKITYDEVDFITTSGTKYLGRRTNIINTEEKHLLKGFFEGEKGKAIKLPGGLFTPSSHFIGVPPFEIDKYTVFWANNTSDMYLAPGLREEKHVFIDDYSIVLGADTFGLYKFDKTSIEDFNPVPYITYETNLSRELIEDNLYENKTIYVGKPSTTREERTVNGYTYVHEIEKIPVFTNSGNEAPINTLNLHTGTDDGVTWYKDEYEIIEGECNVNVFSPNPYEFPKINLPNPDLDFPEIPTIKLPKVKVYIPKIPVVDIRDFTIDIGEFAPLFSGLHKKLDLIIQRQEKIENTLNSIQLPNITWEVPTVGFGDPNLGAENSYPASPKGLQQTIDHLGVILRGLGNTIAHNKSAIGEIGDVIGVSQWRAGYKERVPARLPVSLRKEGDSEPDAIELYTLTQLFQWYITNFDELIGQFDSTFEIADANPQKEGDQPITLTVQNIAEALTEIWGSTTLSVINSELLIQIATKAMVEAGQAKKSTAVNHTYLQAIAAYLNFESEDIKFDMPLSFTPGGENIPDLLQEINCESEGIRFKGKDNLQSSLQDLLQAAAITRAKNFHALGKDLTQSEVAKKIVSRVKEIAKNKAFIQTLGGDFDSFIKDVESGFTENKPGTESVWQDGQEPEIKELEIPKKEDK